MPAGKKFDGANALNSLAGPTVRFKSINNVLPRIRSNFSGLICVALTTPYPQIQFLRYVPVSMTDYILTE
jgi:hypothetical protein